MNKFRWLKHFGWDSMLGQHLIGKGNNAPAPMFERRNYPEASR